MKESQKNAPASIQARLKYEAQNQGRTFAELLQYYGMERFLYRLSKSQYADKFVLKGGLLIYGWNIPLRRPTRDIDLRSYLDKSEQTILRVIKDVIEEPVPEDDIGFSDVLASRVERVNYPTLLKDAKPLRLKSYPKESMVSEKFHAMIRHAQLNSRFKDYYDLWLIADNFEFDVQSLQKAIEKTFAQRNTAIPVERPVGLTAEFAETNRHRWTNFLSKSNLQSEDVENFADVVEKIWTFIEYPIRASFQQESLHELRWMPQKGWS